MQSKTKKSVRKIFRKLRNREIINSSKEAIQLPEPIPEDRAVEQNHKQFVR